MTENNAPDDTNDSQINRNDIGLPRRRFMQAAGAAAGASLLGFGMTGTAVADDLSVDLAHWRVQEAWKAWEKGFRGRPDRTIGLIGHGLEARHPDLGPWNGVRAVPDGEEGLKLVRENLERLDVPDDIRFFSGSFGPNAGNKRNVHGPFIAPKDVDRVEAHLGPAGPPFIGRALRFLLETHPEGEVLAQFQGISPHSALSTWEIEPGEEYHFAVETTFPNNATASYSIEANYQKQTDDTESVTDPFADVNPDNITADTPKVVGWYNEDWELSEATAKPRTGPRGPSSDPRGRSTSIASIMTGSGRASDPDEATVTEEEPNEVLVGPDAGLTYEIEAKPDRGVYGSAYGENIELRLFGPDGQLLDITAHTDDETGNYRRNLLINHLTVHDSGTKTYTCEVHPLQRHVHSPVEPHTIRQPRTVARVKRVSVGAFKKPSNTVGDRTDEDSPTVYAGIAPNSGLVGLSGMYKTRDSMQHLAEKFAELFNLRALHVAMGFGARPGNAGGKLSSPESIKAIAEAGILPVSQTDDVPAPASQPDREAPNADESISVVQTGVHDGVYSGSEPAEPPTIDEDGDGVYRKPDVSAPGGNNLLDFKCAERGRGLLAEDEQKPIRDYMRYGLVRQAPYVVGQASLVAQALEEEAPPGISLPPPAEAELADTMRLKQTILATASETRFTAAPWHKQQPAYTFGGRNPVEGWGRINIDASVEAAARDLTPTSATTSGKGRGREVRAKKSQQGQRPPSKKTTTIQETLGLRVPRHSRAVAGHIAGESGDYEVSVDFSEYSGKHTDMASDPPQIDLFVYNAENPAQHGTPNIVAKTQATTGSASLEFTAGQGTNSATKSGTYYIVAKLVNVPGSFNSFDIQAHIELSVKQI